MNNSSEKLILALDVQDLGNAESLLKKLRGRICIFKVGPVLFTRYGTRVLDMLAAHKSKVFLDLKFHDIPNTVAGAVRAAASAPAVSMLTLHVSGGREMLDAAVAAAAEQPRRPLLLGVTVLTSMNTTPATVLARAREAVNAGLDGVVCSPREIEMLRKKIKNNFLIVTPGIRPAGARSDDQKRTATAAEAVRLGADYLVVGRPILEAVDPLKAAEGLLKEIDSAC